MASAKNPPPGYISLADAAEMVGYTEETIRLAAVTGELTAIQRMKYSPWFVTPADLRKWRGIPEPAEVQAAS